MSRNVKIALLLAALFLPYFLKEMAGGARGPSLEKLEIEGKSGSHVFQVEIASTPEELERGLMFRESLAPDQGMLFLLGQTGVARFWMKNTLIPLDMVFIASDGGIVKIHEKAEPRSLEGISSDAPVVAVLEINGGRARELGIAAGDRVEHPFFKSLP